MKKPKNSRKSGKSAGKKGYFADAIPSPEKESYEEEESSPVSGAIEPVDAIIERERIPPEADIEGAESLEEADLPKS